MTKLFKTIIDQLPSANLATVQRKYFNETKGGQRNCLKTLLL